MSISTVTIAGALAASQGTAQTPSSFGPENPFYAPSTLPYQAPPFDKIKDSDYEPALEAGIAEQLKEIAAIADNPAAPTFDNTLVALEKSGQLVTRVNLVFSGVTQANMDPALQAVQANISPKLAALNDAIYLNTALFKRVESIYNQRSSLGLDAESMRLLEYQYQEFVLQGARLSEGDKAQLKKLNEEEASLTTEFTRKLLAATKNSAFNTQDKNALAGLSDAEIAVAADVARERKVQGWVLPLQNTTQQPDLVSLSDRSTRKQIFSNSLDRAERGDENDTRGTIARMAQLRAQKAQLLGYKTYAAWRLADQMAQTPEAAIKFMDDLVPAATAKARGEAKDIQAIIDADKAGFKLEPYDWELYAEKVRKAKYDLDESQTKPYFELNNVLENGVFYAAHQLYGISFKQRHDIPVYAPEVKVYEVTDADGKPLALWYCDYFKRDNKNGGAWMSNFVNQSTLLGALPVVYNVANFPKPTPGDPALLGFSDVITMFHEFGHALHGMLADTRYPTLSGTNTPRDFVEFPSQFNEHWASDPAVFPHYAKHYQTGAPMPAELAAKLKKSSTFNQGYMLTELLAAAELDMQWHVQPGNAGLQDPDAFEKAALERKHLALHEVPPRYRSSYFMHIWANGYQAGYYAYLWCEMLDDAAYHWFEEHGGLTRANGDRFRRMVLSRGNTEDLEKMYEAWLGGKPGIEPMLKARGLEPDQK